MGHWGAAGSSRPGHGRILACRGRRGRASRATRWRKGGRREGGKEGSREGGRLSGITAVKFWPIYCAVQENSVPVAEGAVATSHTIFLLNRVVMAKTFP